MDWAKDSMGIKYTYTIELRPEYNDENGFILHELQIIPTAKETWEGVKVIADAVLKSMGQPRSAANAGLSYHVSLIFFHKYITKSFSPSSCKLR